MKRSLARVLAALLALLLVGGVTVWWISANYTKQATENVIARINATPSEKGVQFHIAYAGIDTTGLPPNVTVRLTDPVFTMTLPPTPALVTAEGESIPAKPVTTEWAVKGYADITTHYLGASYTLTIRGDDTLTIRNDAATLAIKGTDSRYRFAIKARSFSDFLDWEKLDPRDDAQIAGFLRTVAEASSDIGPLSYADADSNEPAFTQPKGLLRFTNRSNENAFDIDVELLVKDAQIHPAYGRQLQQFKMANPVIAKLGLSADQLPFSGSEMGKQNIDAALSAYVTRGEGSQDRHVRVTVPRLNIQNDYYDVSMPFALDILKRVTDTDFKAKADTRLTLTEKGASEVRKAQDMLYGTIMMVAANNKDLTPETLEALKAAVIEALPDVSKVSPVVLAFDVSGNSVTDAQGRRARKVKADLARFEFSNTHWGLKANGALDTLTSDVPTVNLTLACEKCAAFVQESVKTLGQWQDVSHLADPARPLYPFGEPLQQAVLQFLGTVGKKDEAGTLTFTVTTPAANDVRIGDQPLAAVMMQGMATLAPYLQPVAPAPAK